MRVKHLHPGPERFPTHLQLVSGSFPHDFDDILPPQDLESGARNSAVLVVVLRVVVVFVVILPVVVVLRVVVIVLVVVVVFNFVVGCVAERGVHL